jgi:amino acid adenylation domain-containing protein
METSTTDSLERLAALSPERRALLAQLLQKRAGRRNGDTGGVHDPRPATIVPVPADRHLPFPLNDLQQAYWIGRGDAFQMGEVASHCYVELEGDFDLPRLERALQRVIDRHDMLRAVTLADGQQQVLESVPPYSITVQDLRGQETATLVAELDDIRQRMSHQVLPTNEWPLFEVRATRIDDRRSRLHISLDALFLDGWSISLVLKEWAGLYRDTELPLPPLELTFRDYVLAEMAQVSSDEYRRAEAYWQRRVSDLPPPPELPLAKNPLTIAQPRFVRRTAHLAEPTWSALKKRTAEAGLTTTGILLAAYAEVLSLWSKSPTFTLSVPRFNRLAAHPQVTEIAGEFASFSLVAVDTSGPESFEARARRIQQQLWDDLDHSAYGGVRVLRDLARLQAGGPAAMPIVFTSAPQDGTGRDAYPTIAAAELGEVVYTINQTSQVWLDNHVYEHDGELFCDWDTVDELFPVGMSEDMLQAFLDLVCRLAEDDAAWQWDWADSTRHLLPAAQREQRDAVNATDAPVPDGLLHSVLDRQAAERPDQPALTSNRHTLTYDELSLLSRRWGRRLRELGARPNTLVAVVMEKGWEQVVAALGVQQSGAAYLPIDAGLPRERLWYFLENGEIDLVLTQSWLDERLEWPERVRRLCVDRESLADVDDRPLAPVQQPDDLACCIYTSGSTGLPKGVMLTHRGVMNSIVDTNRHFGIGPSDRVLAVTALHHDMSFYDIFGMLEAGGTLVMPDAAGRRDPSHWSELMRRERVTVWNSVPAMMDMLLEYAEGRTGALPDSLRLAFLGGDWIPLSIPDRLTAQAEDARVVSVGGPTETTLWNIWYPVEAMDPAWRSIPYGRPIANTRYYVLNDALVDCPVWVPGEMYVAGVGVSPGYWRDEAKTRAKFVSHPVTGERLCRTGDLGRYRPDGTIEFVGRADFQVKINGQRIELGEIEAALQEHPAVRAAIVMAVGDAQGKKRLVGYVVPTEPDRSDTDELRRFLLAKLPEHMVPTAYVPLERLPLSRNGKIDRLALTAMAPESAASAPAPAQQSTNIARVAHIVANVLQVDQPDPTANLLTLGANSLDMVRIGNRLEAELGSRPRMDEIFRLQTIEALAGYYDEKQPEQDAPTTGSDQTLPPGNAGAEIDLSSYRVLIEPAEREAFKKRQLGIRPDDERASVRLPRPAIDDALRGAYATRRSQRAFSLKRIPFDALGRFLSCLMQITLDGKPKYRYASPGGLYPTQVYLHVKPGRVEGLDGGTYYYHPIEHQLVSLHPGAEIDRSIHIPFINTPIFDEAAFSVFLVAQIDAIGPGYGEQSLRFVTLEAGVMAHLLESAAPAAGLGLCQIGSLEFDRIRHLFDLDRTHVLIHSLLGGLVDHGRDDGAEGADDEARGDLGKVASTLERIKKLSAEEVRALLDANRPR